LVNRFHYLRLSLALLLVLIGTKFILKDVLPLGPESVDYTLGAIAVALAGGVIASLIGARRRPDSRHVEIPARRQLINRRHRQRVHSGSVGPTN
jgi:predicted tellurium resistance membrane protein TerC